MSRLAIVGFGTATPGGIGVPALTKNLKEGLCALEVVEGIAPEGRSLVVGRVSENLDLILGTKYKHQPRVSKLSLISTKEALQSASLKKDSLDPFRTAVVVGTSLGGFIHYDDCAILTYNKNFRRFPLTGAGASQPHSVASDLAGLLGIHGIVKTVSTGCTTGSDVLLDAKLLLDTNTVDRVVLSSVDSTNIPTVIYSFVKLKSMTPDGGLSVEGIPFSDRDNSFVPAESSVTVILEREDCANARGAKIYGFIDSLFMTNDAASAFYSDESGKFLKLAIEKVLKGRKPDYVNSQALGLKVNDMIEYRNHMGLFGDSVPITSVKSTLGHPMGACGLVQLACTIISFDEGFIPATLSTDKYGFEDLPVVLEPLYTQPSSSLITTHGFGGNNNALFVTKF